MTVSDLSLRICGLFGVDLVTSPALVQRHNTFSGDVKCQNLAILGTVGLAWTSSLKGPPHAIAVEHKVPRISPNLIRLKNLPCLGPDASDAILFPPHLENHLPREAPRAHV